jgi:hypothetical protein
VTFLVAIKYGTLFCDFPSQVTLHVWREARLFLTSSLNRTSECKLYQYSNCYTARGNIGGGLRKTTCCSLWSDYDTVEEEGDKEQARKGERE